MQIQKLNGNQKLIKARRAEQTYKSNKINQREAKRATSK